jgi:hypothetical protein
LVETILTLSPKTTWRRDQPHRSFQPAVNANLAIGSGFNIAAPTNGALIQGNVISGGTAPRTALDVVGIATLGGGTFPTTSNCLSIGWDSIQRNTIHLAESIKDELEKFATRRCFAESRSVVTRCQASERRGSIDSNRVSYSIRNYHRSGVPSFRTALLPQGIRESRLMSQSRHLVRRILENEYGFRPLSPFHRISITATYQ